jgi:hypothetical protein
MTDTKKKRSGCGCTAFLGVVLLLVLFFVVGQFGSHQVPETPGPPANIPAEKPKPSPKPKPTVSAEIKKGIEDWIRSGQVEVDRTAWKAYVAPAFWESLDHRQKEDLAFALAVYVDEGRSSGLSIDLYDKQSGKKIAKWTDFSGMKFY